MERSLELYDDGRLYEYEGDQAVKLTDTQRQVTALLEALKFTTATTFSVAAPDQQPPDVPTPRGNRRINAEGFKLLTLFEGCKLEAYDDGGGVWTIGYGHTKGVVPGMKITQAQAEKFLHEDLERFQSYVEEAVQVEVNDNQFSALVCFCFNVGPGNGGFGGSTLLRKLNAGDDAGAAQQFPRWNKVDGKPWLGLTRRRLAEQALFLSKPWEFARNYNGPADVSVGNPNPQGHQTRSIDIAESATLSPSA
ncbi:MAG: lysozyme [Oculatellaceae cyanobacterium Prado106]|jgi:GH24 family phage-related lysozyme (muramidase)|nr:lysozyme [Oculatellaceae cyanobacterium Prado106]